MSTKKTIVVAGGAGYIGSHTVVELQQHGYDVVIVDNLSNSSIDVLDNIAAITGIKPVFELFDLADEAHVGAEAGVHVAVLHRGGPVLLPDVVVREQRAAARAAIGEAQLARRIATG